LNKTSAGHPLWFTNMAGKGTVVTVALGAVSASGTGPAPAQLAPLLLEHAARLAGPPPLEVIGGNAGLADIVLRTQHNQSQGAAPRRWVLHFLTNEQLDVKLNTRYIPASRIVWQYPPIGWKCSLVGSTLEVQPGDAVHGRLVALE
jgi:hypothetical protein